MLEPTVKRRTIIKYFGSSLFLALLSGCFGPKVISIKDITLAVRTVVSLLDLCNKLSNDTLYSMNVSFNELEDFLRAGNFTTEIIQHMEKRYSLLSTHATQLSSQLNKTNSSAEQLFSLLDARAKQNSSPDLKKQMKSDIRNKRKEFKGKMKIATSVLSNIGDSVKKYDDILGYIQVGTGINQIDQYLNDVDSVIAQANILNTNIKNAIREGTKIIETFDI